MKWILLLLSAQVLSGTTYYVAPGGFDGNPGTIDRPLSSISKAVKIALPGDTIILRDGVYGPEGLTSGFPVWITHPGTPDAWITLKAENKGKAILDCQNGSGTVRTGCDGYIYFHTGAAYWVLEDLVFQHGFSFGASANSVPAANNILVRGCRFEYIGQHPSDSQYGEVGFYVGQGSFNFTFDSNVFHDIGRTSGQYMGNDHGLYLHCSETTVTNNIFYAPISGWGIQTANHFSGLIANNTFAFPMQNTRGHIMLWQVNASVTIRNNIFYNPGGATAVDTSGFSIILGCSIDHNIVMGGVIGNATGCKVSSNFNGDPGFINAAYPPYDFHLRGGGPAIAVGLPIPAISTDFDGRSRPLGLNFDLGAYKYAPISWFSQNQPESAQKISRK